MCCVCTTETDIWLLDGDDAISQSHEAPPSLPRPDHLDFLRITPPEDDIIGDTPYYPTLELTVSVNVNAFRSAVLCPICGHKSGPGKRWSIKVPST